MGAWALLKKSRLHGLLAQRDLSASPAKTHPISVGAPPEAAALTAELGGFTGGTRLGQIAAILALSTSNPRAIYQITSSYLYLGISYIILSNLVALGRSMASLLPCGS